jgi:hypothetical protein
MNVTPSLDDQTLAQTRLTASADAQAAAELERLWSEEEGDSGGGSGVGMKP